jgi:hypothetical protein
MSTKTYPAHPLAKFHTGCQKCGASAFLIQLPGFPGDAFNCLACGQSWAPTAKQVKAMTAPRKR